MFMHGGVLHIAGNMLFLWIFGNNIEDSMTARVFVVFYVLGGLVAMLAQTLATRLAVPTLGASGAIAAVLGGYALLYPRARVMTLVIIVFFITLRAARAAGARRLVPAAVADSAAEQVGQGGVAYFAHIGGFAFGLRRSTCSPPATATTTSAVARPGVLMARPSCWSGSSPCSRRPPS